MARDYYSILGVPKGTSDVNLLKKQYRKMAMKYHPDKAEGDKDAANKKFQEISQAWAVLSDPDSKKVYDLGGEEALKNGVPTGDAFGSGMPGAFRFSAAGRTNTGAYTFGPEDAERIFSRFYFGGMGGGSSDPFGGHAFGGLGGRRRAGMGPRAGTAYARMPRTGFNFFMHTDSSSDDETARTRKSPRTHTFSTAGGASQTQSQGFKRSAQPTEAVYDVNCSLQDLYRGKLKKLRVTCITEDPIAGESKDVTKELRCEILPGMREGTQIRFAGAGDSRLGQPAQDVVFVVREKKDLTFERDTGDRDNLSTTVHINLKDALGAGAATVMVPTIDGNGVEVPLEGTIQPGSTITLEGYGMPKQSGVGYGNLLVTFQVELPTLNAAQKAAMACTL